MTTDLQKIIEISEKEINNYLEDALREDRIDQQSYDIAKAGTINHLKTWLLDPNIEKLSKPTMFKRFNHAV